jgi:glycosyltransferase involved in cell wall biosynthesis
MKIVYSLSHPAHRLDSGAAGHTVRARALLGALERRGHEIVTMQAATDQATQSAVKTYHGLVKKLLPRPVAMRMRDMARVRFSRRYAQLLFDGLQQHRPDLILETHNGFAVAGKLASERSGLPLVLDDVAPSWEEEREFGVGLKQRALNIYREVTGHASLLVAVNDVMRQLLIEDGVPATKLVTVSNGIDPDYFHPNIDGSAARAQYAIPAETIVIVFVGSFQTYHRVDLLLEAFSRVTPNQTAHLLLVGDGKRAPEARDQTQRLGLSDHVTFCGRIPYEDVSRYVAAGNVTIMPATNSYGNPMKIYEYAAMGKAILAPNQETITEIVAHDESAYLFAPEDVDSMAAALTAVIQDGALRQRLRQNATQLAHKHTWEQRAIALEQAIQQVIAS